MAVPSVITDLSTTAASNSPAGSDSPALLDDHIRALAAFIAQLRDGTYGTMSLLSTATASASSTIDFTSGISSTYKKYILEIIDYVPATDNTEIWLRVSQAASFLTGANYGYGTGYTNYTTAGYVGGDTVGTKMILANGINSGSGYGLSGHVEIYNPAGTAKRKNFQWDLTQYNSSGVARYYGSGTYAANNTAIDGLRILSSSGNITSGTFKLYGVN